MLKGSGPLGAEIQNHLSLKRSASQEASPCLLRVLTCNVWLRKAPKCAHVVHLGLFVSVYGVFATLRVEMGTIKVRASGAYTLSSSGDFV